MKQTPAEVLAELREAGLAQTQAQLADLLGVSQPTVCEWLANKQEMSRPVRMLAEAWLDRVR